MNTYSKYCANVFVAKCTEQHEKGSIITLTTKYGKENESIVFNFLGKTKDGFYLHSIVRADGYNVQERAKRKSEQLANCALNAEKKSQEYFKASEEGKDFLSLGEPIKIGHHSEKRHRALIDRNWNRIGKGVEFSDKADDYKSRADYWKKKESTINLSMPESLEYWKFRLNDAKEIHQFLKDNPSERGHSMSLQYANRNVKEALKNLDLAVKLWGEENEVIQELEENKKAVETKKQAKQSKQDKFNKLVDDLGGFFAFNNEQFEKGYNEILERGIIEKGDKVTHLQAGLYVPSKHVDTFLKGV